MDDTKPDGSSPCIMGFILADQARDLVDMTPDQRRDLLAKHYATVFRCPEMEFPINYTEKNWMEEEYSGGCYVSTFPPGILTKFAECIRQPYLLTYFAGTETATYWIGYMEGAIQAGERAAREVLHAMGRIGLSDIWVDEPGVPEFPELPVEKMFLEKILPSVPTFLGFCVAFVGAVGAWLTFK